MDELEISGKRYISTRRAGKENKYHSDYIGQLIRAGKVEGQKVGRSWYVGEQSLADYLNNEAAAKNAPRPAHKAEEMKPVPVVVAAALAPELKPEVKIEPVSAPAPVVVSVPIAAPEPRTEIKEAEEKIIEIDKDEHLIPVKIAGPAETYMRKSGLRYVSDNEPLYPPLRNQHKVVTVITEPDAEAYLQEDTQHDFIEKPRAKRSNAALLTRAGVVVAAGALVLVALAGATALVSSTTIVQEGQPASTGFSIGRL